MCVPYVCFLFVLNGFYVVVPTASNSNKAIVFSAVILLLITLAHILINACVWESLESHVGKQSSPNLNPAPSVQGAHGGQSGFG